MKTIEKNLLDIEYGVICHQTNCKQKFNSGVAKSIREKWPIVYETYMDFCNEQKDDWMLLGEILPVKIERDLWVVNIFGQYDFGYDGRRYTEYCAFRQALHNLTFFKEIYSVGAYFPERCASDRGGADWNIISNMIDKFIPNATICRLPK